MNREKIIVPVEGTTPRHTWTAVIKHRGLYKNEMELGSRLQWRWGLRRLEGTCADMIKDIEHKYEILK